MLTCIAPPVIADAVPVRVLTPQQLTLTRELSLTGTLTAERSARLSARVDGLVETLEVDAGDRVKQGDLLLQLDADLAEHALRRISAQAQQSKAQLAEAQRLVTEARKLVGQRHLPRTELDRREAELALAKAAYAAAQAGEREQAELVRRHALPAPFDGVISRRLTDIGEWVTRGVPVLELVATDRVRLDVQAPQEHFAAIRKDAEVQVRVAGAGELQKGRIIARVPVGEAGARTFLVRIVLAADDTPLLPGASATALIKLRGSQPALAAPRDALLRYPDGTHSLFVIEQRRGATIARERRVEVGGGGEQVEILQGLRAGERIVVRGNESLRDGQAVTIVASNEEP
ncbi:MAG: efflux RND transporter periplasmic adaptor subunit [Pseudomonadota bacterium]|nr:efflux RND transporter periplasmic adaptor subunit [Pseudomonadota bacterium]